MQGWPSIRRVLAVWGTLTLAAFAGYVIYLHRRSAIGPPDELVMANSLAFQATIAAIVVGIVSVAFLFLCLAIGAIAKRWLVQGELRNDRKL